MRIGIDYRFLASGISVNRGMGRYTQQQLREVLRLDAQNEYILFCPANSDVSLVLPEIRQAPTVSIASNAITVRNKITDLIHREKTLAYAEEFQVWVDRQKLDLFHATTPLLLEVSEANVPGFDVCPLVATLYDLIPLIFSNQYLPANSLTRELYFPALHFLLEAQRLIAISASAKHDAATYLGFREAAVEVAYPMADPWFQVLPPDECERTLAPLRRKLNLPGDFLLTVSHLHFSKNLETLLRGYSYLPKTLRQKLPLVATFHLTEGEKQHLAELAKRYEIADTMLVTGFVTEHELAALYNRATLVIHPSRYEGFGLPVLEAMTCGAPVVTTTASSLPEVGGTAAMLVDPDDPRAFAEAIESLAHDSARREEMRHAGLAWAGKFGGEQLARQTLLCYHSLHAPVKAPSETQPRLALWTPLPPQKSGIAVYVTELLPSLTRRYEIELFVDDGFIPSLDLLCRYRIRHHTAFERRHARHPFDAIIYQMGASTFHLYMYSALQRWPGLVVLHDLTWGHVLYYMSVISGRLADFKQTLLELEGPTALRDFEAALNAPAADKGGSVEAFLGQHYLLGPIIEHSLAVAVHTRPMVNELVEQYGCDKVNQLQFGVEDPQRNLPIHPLITRSQLGLSPEAFVVGIFGILDPVKRIEVSLRAFRDLCNDYPQACLIIVGEAHAPEYLRRLHDVVRALGIEQQVYFTGHIAPEMPANVRYNQILLTCDLVISLRYPSRKQMSGTLLHALAAGKPIIVTDLPEWEELPNEFCWRVPADATEQTVLAGYLKRLAGDPSLRQQLSQQARDYFLRERTVDVMADSYDALIRQLLDKPPAALAFNVVEAEAWPALGINKLCEAEDFAHPVLRHEINAIVRHLFAPTDTENRHPRRWAAAMSLRTLRTQGALHRQARILGIGHGFTDLPFHLTDSVHQVFMVDCYGAESAWPAGLGVWMLSAPETLAPYPCDLTRLVVQTMDASRLRFPSEMFEGVFALDALSMLGNLQQAANMMFEIGRVLKPGGVATVTIRYCLSGMTRDRVGPAGLLLTSEDVQKYVVEASGLELIEPFQTRLSAKTLAAHRNLAVQTDKTTLDTVNDLLTVVGSSVFALGHLALRKTAQYPTTDNQWAEPNQNTSRCQPKVEVAPFRLQALGKANALVEPPTNVWQKTLGRPLVQLVEAFPHVYGIYARMLKRLPPSLAAPLRRSIEKLKP